jgi:hypothetical protein
LALVVSAPSIHKYVIDDCKDVLTATGNFGNLKLIVLEKGLKGVLRFVLLPAFLTELVVNIRA